MSEYTKDAQGNIVKKKWWHKDKPVELPPPLPPTATPPPQPQPQAPPVEQGVDVFEVLLANQAEIYALLESIAGDIAVIKDDSVDEATRRFKELQNEVVNQIAELETKKKTPKKQVKK